jgi:type IV pilus assembly protein PilW
VIRRSVQVQRGFSLVELMVAMGLSLILLAGALSILYSTRLTYVENERLARIQESGRTAIEIISRDARAAGFSGCSRLDPDKFDNALVDNATLLWNFEERIHGFEATGGAWDPVLPNVLIPDATVDSDVLLLRTSRQGLPVFRTTASTLDPTAAISVLREPGQAVAPGQTMVISDCEFTTVFAATSMTDGATVDAATIEHTIDVISAVTPANEFNTVTSNFKLNSLVTPIDTVIYYVRPMAVGAGPGLWQKVGAQDPQLLVEGVENLQVRYGVDTDNNLVVNEYMTADEVDGDDDWANVVSISIAILIRSDVESGVETDRGTYNLLGTDLGPFDDRRQRSVYTTTIALRNGAT